eukprot:CAMPEP_0174935086 /NCGR_PEP_ID=MMETSP1355-20121228/52237_1 /TAXON_ID=464990 /ORGANISM="Hemiselmis tepida, Strain CCMP443" /LENGTH=66 /DNA_ID=CAMNT_0016181745 /DNA_START=149 /DNA_END=346 /DNA_ORIENTATION=+
MRVPPKVLHGAPVVQNNLAAAGMLHNVRGGAHVELRAPAEDVEDLLVLEPAGLCDRLDVGEGREEH